MKKKGSISKFLSSGVIYMTILTFFCQVNYGFAQATAQNFADQMKEALSKIKTEYVTKVEAAADDKEAKQILIDCLRNLSKQLPTKTDNKKAYKTSKSVQETIELLGNSVQFAPTKDEVLSFFEILETHSTKMEEGQLPFKLEFKNQASENGVMGALLFFAFGGLWGAIAGSGASDDWCPSKKDENPKALFLIILGALLGSIAGAAFGMAIVFV